MLTPSEVDAIGEVQAWNREYAAALDALDSTADLVIKAVLATGILCRGERAQLNADRPLCWLTFGLGTWAIEGQLMEGRHQLPCERVDECVATARPLAQAAIAKVRAQAEWAVTLATAINGAPGRPE